VSVDEFGQPRLQGPDCFFLEVSPSAILRS
jgi:hypothetical protein